MEMGFSLAVFIMVPLCSIAKLNSNNDCSNFETVKFNNDKG